jgi:hypothetical protein
MAFVLKLVWFSKLYNRPFSRGVAGISLLIFALVQVKVSKIASHGIVKTEGFEVPFSRLFGVVTTRSSVSPAYLQTDASDYGIGAYLFQRVRDEDHPVAILSKTLDRTQLRWATPEKEGYAIFYALKRNWITCYEISISPYKLIIKT